MSNDLATGIASWLSNSWRFFTEITIPTTNITMGQLAIALILVPIALRFMGIMLPMKITGNLKVPLSLFPMSAI